MDVDLQKIRREYLTSPTPINEEIYVTALKRAGVTHSEDFVPQFFSTRFYLDKSHPRGLLPKPAECYKTRRVTRLVVYNGSVDSTVQVIDGESIITITLHPNQYYDFTHYPERKFNIKKELLVKVAQGNADAEFICEVVITFSDYIQL